DVNLQTPAGDEPAWRLPSEVSASKGVGVNWGGFPPRGSRTPIGGAKTPLLYATRLGDLEITRLLIAAGADIEQSDANGDTPLLTAIINATVASKPGVSTEHVATAHFLIVSGANVNAA